MLNKEEQAIAEQIYQLKSRSGSPAPSILSLKSQIKDLKIKVDACFLSNPYATDLFLEHLSKDLILDGKLKEALEYYPSQNRQISALLEPVLKVSADHIFLGNGAIEIIQALIHRFTKGKILINLPTFSSYYEFVRPGTEVIFNLLDKNRNFELDPKSFLECVHLQRPDSVVIINPNNPDGGYIPQNKLIEILQGLQEVEMVILDESFIHFAYENEDYAFVSNSSLLKQFPNLVIVKSMSKDFGIAGIRAGYALMAKEKVDQLLGNGYLWNVSGLAEYFFRLFAEPEFQKSYEPIRVKYIKETQEFYEMLKEVPKIRVFPSRANFFLVELLDGLQANNVALELLIRHGIYTRSCRDKIGLTGEFLRIASRSREENRLIVGALKEVMSLLL